MKALLNFLKRTTTPTTVPTVPQTYNPPIQIAVVNSCTVLSDSQITPVVQALQIQVSRDFAPVYGLDAKLVQVSKGAKVPAGMWQLVMLDNADQAGALGYHDLTTDGLPL